MKNVYPIKHPLIAHKIGLLRDKDLCCKDFRQITAEITSLLVYEATKDLELENVMVNGWAGPVEVQKLQGKKITIVPILRAGLGMLEGVYQLLPNAKVSIVGMYRNEETLNPVPYYQKFTSQMPKRCALIVDPMLATGGSLSLTIQQLKQQGCKLIKGLFLVGTPMGIKKVTSEHPDVEIYLAQIDPELNDVGYILPGLGDAGDKIFGTK